MEFELKLWSKTGVLLETAVAPASSELLPRRSAGTVEELEEEIETAKSAAVGLQNALVEQRDLWEMELKKIEEQIEQEKRAWQIDMEYLEKLYAQEKSFLIENVHK
jgi:hypothetical protein